MIFLKHRISPPKSILLISTGIFRMSLGELSKWKKCLFSNICSSEDCYYTTSPASHHPNDHNVSQKWEPPLSSNIVFDARRPMAVMGQRSRLVFTKISHFKWEKICAVFILNVSDFIALLVCDIFSIFLMIQELHKNFHTNYHRLKMK